ncbi:helix-turn-helix transcriptional regulator [Nonomuraea jiangxiensis]|uniref:Helix-turn-helix domain-containing protein n=1 Tax=Nonomuraea jiangxiensis TaxID=633440 RepID=A0A1G8BDL8_9ACTN|nr:helix-turn-helix transcriptional regulator [Nonomuraea jiangxiensis]SDH31191.1 Helix-turn-helix domain-containing protein [Nonomuraea jiangxiensis]
MDSSRLLGEFLRARRQAITPEWAGLADGFRRTPGLRREEVAVLAGISTDYYARLEQGRERHPSEQLLRALARVLNLGSDATAHLYELAYPERRQSPVSRDPAQISPHLLRLMESRPFPAVVCDRRQDVLAHNRLFPLLYANGRHLGNLLRLVFLDPVAREFYLDWEDVARARVAALRASAGADLNSPRMVSLVEELSRGSEDFARLWACHEVIGETSAIRRVRHPVVGDMIFAYEAFSPQAADGQHLIMLHPEPGSVTERRLALLDPSGAPEPELLP